MVYGYELRKIHVGPHQVYMSYDMIWCRHDNLQGDNNKAKSKWPNSSNTEYLAIYDKANIITVCHNTTQTFVFAPRGNTIHARDLVLLHFLLLLEYLEVQYFFISSAVLPGILPAIKGHLKLNECNYIVSTVFKLY